MVTILDDIVGNPTFESDCIQILENNKKNTNETNFKERWYYTPKMKGSYSIKYVLPALVPSLSYDHLEINNGSLASSTFASIHNITNEKKVITTRKNLLAYCKRDTFAMVKILDVLRSV